MKDALLVHIARVFALSAPLGERIARGENVTIAFPVVVDLLFAEKIKLGVHATGLLADDFHENVREVCGE